MGCFPSFLFSISSRGVIMKTKRDKVHFTCMSEVILKFVICSNCILLYFSRIGRKVLKVIVRSLHFSELSNDM